MNFKRRSAGGGEIPQKSQSENGKNQSVVVYIILLFMAAFFLMTWSFFIHQRSNTEALGELRDSVTAMQAVQDTYEQVIALQRELAEAENALEDAQDALAETERALESLEKEKADCESQLQEANADASVISGQLNAMTALYTLQQKYSARDYTTCQEILQEMEDSKLTEQLPDTPPAEGVTPPSVRYTQLKEAVERLLARSAGTAN